MVRTVCPFVHVLVSEGSEEDSFSTTDAIRSDPTFSPSCFQVGLIARRRIVFL